MGFNLYSSYCSIEERTRLALLVRGKSIVQEPYSIEACVTSYSCLLNIIFFSQEYFEKDDILNVRA